MPTSRLDKQRLTDYLLDTRNALLAEAYQGAVYGFKTNILAKRLRDTALRYMSAPLYMELVDDNEEVGDIVHDEVGDSPLGLAFFFLSYAIRIAKTAKYKARVGKTYQERADIAFDFMKRSHCDRNIATTIFALMNRIETAVKKREIGKALEKGVFFLVSEHADSAQDHAPYQGRIYVNKNWRNLVHDKETRKRINIYVHANDIDTFQWVTDNPVYLITRPNCRHYFITLSPSEVLDSYGAYQLLVKHDMIHAEGERGALQTLSASAYANAESALKQYRDRLRYLDSLRKVMPTEELDKMYTKTKFLINKWRKIVSRG